MLKYLNFLYSIIDGICSFKHSSIFRTVQYCYVHSNLNIQELKRPLGSSYFLEQFFRLFLEQQIVYFYNNLVMMSLL